MSHRFLALMMISLLGALSIAATVQADEGRLEIEDIFNLESVADPQISPDGKQIIYVRRFADIMTDKRYANLWIIEFDGSGHRPLTSGHYSDGSPRWSPDGSSIAFASMRSGNGDIWTTKEIPSPVEQTTWGQIKRHFRD